MKKYFFLSVLLLFTLVQLTAQVREQPFRVLFVGNSYTYFWNLPQNVAAMAESRDLALVTRQSTAGGVNLGQHWRSEKGLESRALIREGGFDAVVIQDHSLRAIAHPDSLLHYGEKFVALIREKGARPFVYITWARKNNPLTQETITGKYMELAERIHAGIVPVGPAWEAAKKANPDIQLFDEDGSHPNPLGTYLAACVFYGVLTQDSPIGLPNRLITVDRDGEKLYLNIQSEEKAAFCQQIADRVVRSFMD
jgi:hypothetical protein